MSKKRLLALTAALCLLNAGATLAQDTPDKPAPAVQPVEPDPKPEDPDAGSTVPS